MNFYLYYCYAADGTLLYVGQTSDVEARLDLHGHYSSATSTWFYFCTRVAVSPPLASRRDATDAERTEIKRLRPVFNRHHNDDPTPWVLPAGPAPRRYGSLPQIALTPA